MNFKNEYKNDFDNIRLNEDFKNDLARKMNQKSLALRNYRMYGTVLAAVAMLAIVVGIGFWQNAQGQKNVGIKAENTTTVTGSEGLFVTDKWYGDAGNDVEIYEAFVKLLEGGTIKTLYCSAAETFGDEDILEADKVTELTGKLVAAVPTDGEFIGAVKNYMAVFEGGEIVKFQVSDAGFVKLNDANTIFKIEK